MKKNKLTKILILIFALVMVFSLTACSDEKDVTSAATTFLDKCVDGDFDAAEKLCSSSAASSLGIKDVRSTMESQFDLGFSSSSGTSISSYSKTTQEAYNDFIDYTLKKLVKSYTLNDDYDNDKKSISAKVKVLDTDSASSTAFQSEIQKMATDYYEKHKSALIKVYQSGGQTALQKKLMNDLAPKMFESAKTDYIDKIKTKTITWKLTFKKNKSGKWIVDSASQSE